MIAILKEDDIDRIVKSYMHNDNTNYILRLIKVFSKAKERYCLFSLDYMNDNNKNYSLITYNNKKCTCTYCNHSVGEAMLFLLNDDLVNICFSCLGRKHFSFSPDINTAFIAKLLAKHNHVEMLDKLFSNWDTEFNYYGYRVRNVSKSKDVFYYLDTRDRYSLHSFDKNEPFDVTFNETHYLYLYNYYLLMKLLKRTSDEEVCHKVLSKNFSQEELQDAMITLTKFDQSEKIEIIAQSNFSTATAIFKSKELSLNPVGPSDCFSQETSASHQVFEPRAIFRSHKSERAGEPCCLTGGAQRRRESDSLNSTATQSNHTQKQTKEITSIKSKSDNVLEVGRTYKNAKIKLLHVPKDHRGFFKGNYKFLYIIYYGSHALLWNTNKIVEDGNYTGSFIVQRSAHSKGYMFVNNCRLKKIEKES